jgi:Lon-like ATP-dependent protease
MTKTIQRQLFSLLITPASVIPVHLCIYIVAPRLANTLFTTNMIPLRSALRSSTTTASCRRCRPTNLSIAQSLSSTTTRPISHYLRPSAPTIESSIAARSLHSTSRLGKDNKKWLNHADEEGEAKDDKDKDKKEVESKSDKEDEAESSKSASERALKEKESTVTAESAAGGASASASGSGSASSNPSSSDSSTPPKTGKEIAKPSIPETYPQVLALPITRRPLFPGFYKAVTITSPPVIKAIRELLAHGQPYIGAFLLKDSESDSDVITSIDQVHPVGVFAQITSVFGSTEPQATKDDKEPAGEPKPETLTAVLYPHRRIRIDELITSAPPPAEAVPIADVVDQIHREETLDESEVASFEKEVPSVDEVKGEVDSKGESATFERG